MESFIQLTGKIDHLLCYITLKLSALLQREMAPLMLEEGVAAAYLTLENGGICVLGISQPGKGKYLEIRAWDVMSSLGFTAKEITVQDLQRNATNDGKFK